MATRRNSAAERVLREAGYSVQAGDDKLILTDSRAIAHPETVAKLLVDAGLPLVHLQVEEKDLEAYFLKRTGADGGRP